MAAATYPISPLKDIVVSLSEGGGVVAVGFYPGTMAYPMRIGGPKDRQHFIRRFRWVRGLRGFCGLSEKRKIFSGSVHQLFHSIKENRPALEENAFFFVDERNGATQ